MCRPSLLLTRTRLGANGASGTSNVYVHAANVTPGSAMGALNVRYSRWSASVPARTGLTATPRSRPPIAAADRKRVNIELPSLRRCEDAGGWNHVPLMGGRVSHLGVTDTRAWLWLGGSELH